MRTAPVKMIVACVVVTLCISSANAQWQAPVKAIAVKGLWTAAQRITPEKLAWFLGGMKHTWWYARYEDGTTVYNNFRSYRSGSDVYRYFAGKTDGDCDSRDLDGQTFCYRGIMDAEHHVSIHGPVVDIAVMGSDEQYKSAWDF